LVYERGEGGGRKCVKSLVEGGGEAESLYHVTTDWKLKCARSPNPVKVKALELGIRTWDGVHCTCNKCGQGLESTRVDSAPARADWGPAWEMRVSDCSVVQPHWIDALKLSPWNSGVCRMCRM
jgi:hypothetical protein